MYLQYTCFLICVYAWSSSSKWGSWQLDRLESLLPRRSQPRGVPRLAVHQEAKQVMVTKPGSDKGRFVETPVDENPGMMGVGKGALHSQYNVKV